MIKNAITPTAVKHLSADFTGDGDFLITGVSALKSCGPQDVSFYKGDDPEVIRHARCGALIVHSDFRNSIVAEDTECQAIIFHDYPMGLFTDIVNARFDNNFTDQSLTNPQGHHISRHAYVEDTVTFGSNFTVYPHATIYDGTVFGDNCVVQSNTVIAGVGMSYVRKANGQYSRLTHLGDVVIGNNVEIGCNTTVLRGILESTTIEDGAKIGNQVNIGHSSTIGENTYISAGAVVGGATVVGRNCWIAPGVSIRDNLKIGENCTLGVGCVVISDTEPNSVYVGNPARLIKRKPLE